MPCHLAARRYQANELLHARWAMLAAAGAIIPEGLAANGADVKGATWFETGAVRGCGGGCWGKPLAAVAYASYSSAQSSTIPVLHAAAAVWALRSRKATTDRQPASSFASLCRPC